MDEEPSEPVIVPHQQLTQEALRGLVESFVLREGTDYGVRETSLDDKVAQVLGQLQRREAYVVYEPASDTVSIVPARALPDHDDRRDE